MKAPVFELNDPVTRSLFISAKAVQAMNRPFREGAIEVLPGIWSNDLQFQLFKTKLADILTRTFPSNVTEDGHVYGNGVRTNFYGLRHINGFGMLPATVPWADNRRARQDKGLVDVWQEDWHENIFRALIRLSFEGIQPQPLKLKEGSSSTIPWFTNNMTEKTHIARKALADAQKAGDLMLGGNYYEAFLKYKMGGAHYMVYREQSSDTVDKIKGQFVAKDRPVADLEYAITGGTSGTYKPADKHISEADGVKVLPGMFRTRKRSANATPLTINSPLLVIAQAVRHNMYERWPFTLHSRTRQELEDHTRSWKFTIAADVGNHDQLWPMELYINTAVDELRKMGFAEWWIEIFRVVGYLPRFVTGVSPTSENLLIGDWRKPDINGGLTSGEGFTDLKGTWGMCACYMIMQVEYTCPQLIPMLKDFEQAVQLVDEYMKGNLDIKLKDKSDDALLGWTNPRLVPAARKLHSMMKNKEQVSPYMEIGYEHGGAFLGGILLFPESGNTEEMRVIGNIQSYVVNQFAPEYGVFSQVRDRSKLKRPYPGLAWASMDDVYGSSPIYYEVKDIIERTWFEVYGTSYIQFREEMLRHDQLLLAKNTSSNHALLDLTPIELEVLADPSKLDYKYLPSDVRSELLNSLFKGLTLAEVEPFFKSVVN